MARHPLLSLLPLCAGLSMAGGGCQRVDCDTLCQRVKKCQPEVARALVERQPSQSKMFKSVRKELPERILPHLIKSCPRRCEAVAKTSYGKKRLLSCASIKACDAFAKCIAPSLEP